MPSKKLKRTAEEIDLEIVDGRTIAEWEKSFDLIEGGFSGDIGSANHKIGVIMVMHNASVAFIGSGTAKGQGLLARLRQIALIKSTGNKHYGAQEIIKHLGQIELKLLMFERDQGAVERVKAITKLLQAKHTPKWNASARRVQEALAQNIITRQHK